MSDDSATTPKSTEQGYLERGARAMMIITSVGFALNFVFNLVLSRLLSPEDFGDFKVADSFIDLCQVAVLLGGSVAALRFLPDYMGGPKREAVWEYTRFYMMVMLGMSLLVIAGTAFVTFLNTGPVDLQHHHPLVFAVLVVPVSAAVAMIRKPPQAAKDLRLAFVPYWIGYPIIALALVGLVYMINGEVTDIGAVFIIFVVNVLILIYIWYHVHRRGHMPLKRDTHVSVPKEWLKISMPMMMIVTVQIIVRQTDIYMLEILGGEAEVGLFAACSTIAGVMIVVQSSIVGVLTPLMTQAAEQGTETVAELNRKGQRKLFLIGLPVVVLIAVFADEILGLFGPTYPQAVTALYILLAAFFVQISLTLPAIWLRYCGYVNPVLVVLIGQALLVIGLNFWLIPRYGVTGAAISTAIAYGLGRIAMVILMRRYMGVWSLRFL